MADQVQFQCKIPKELRDDIDDLFFEKVKYEPGHYKKKIVKIGFLFMRIMLRSKNNDKDLTKEQIKIIEEVLSKTPDEIFIKF